MWCKRFLYWEPSKTHYDIITYVQNIVLLFSYVNGTAVKNNMLKFHDNIPHIKGVIATRVKHKCTGKLEVFIMAGGGLWHCSRLSPVYPCAPICAWSSNELQRFEDWAPTDIICGCLIFNSVAVTDLMIGHPDTVETLYNTINFCWSTHKRHSIARPKGRGMGCLLWVPRATYCIDLSILSSIKYLL